MCQNQSATLLQCWVNLQPNYTLNTVRIRWRICRGGNGWPHPQPSKGFSLTRSFILERWLSRPQSLVGEIQQLSGTVVFLSRMTGLLLHSVKCSEPQHAYCNHSANTWVHAPTYHNTNWSPQSKHNMHQLITIQTDHHRASTTCTNLARQKQNTNIATSTCCNLITAHRNPNNIITTWQHHIAAITINGEKATTIWASHLNKSSRQAGTHSAHRINKSNNHLTNTNW